MADFSSFREFYPFYLGEHRNRTCRRLHFVGTSFAIGFIVLAIKGGTRGGCWRRCYRAMRSPGSAISSSRRAVRPPSSIRSIRSPATG